MNHVLSVLRRVLEEAPNTILPSGVRADAETLGKGDAKALARMVVDRVRGAAK